MPSLTSRCMYRLGCHRFVALYMLTESFNVRVTARIKSAAPRTNRGSALNTSAMNGVLVDVASQKDKSITWTIATGGRATGDGE